MTPRFGPGSWRGAPLSGPAPDPHRCNRSQEIEDGCFTPGSRRAQDPARNPTASSPQRPGNASPACAPEPGTPPHSGAPLPGGLHAGFPLVGLSPAGSEPLARGRNGALPLFPVAPSPGGSGEASWVPPWARSEPACRPSFAIRWRSRSPWVFREAGPWGPAWPLPSVGASTWPGCRWCSWQHSPARPPLFWWSTGSRERATWSCPEPCCWPEW